MLSNSILFILYFFSNKEYKLKKDNKIISNLYIKIHQA